MATASLLTLNTTVPTIDRVGTPYIVFFDNGDWEIAMQGDIEFIIESSTNFLGAEPFIDFFIGLMIFFDLGDADDLDVSDGLAYLMISETVQAGGGDEPVMLIYQDGVTDVVTRQEAENIISLDPNVGYNFIPALDLFEDYRTYRARHEDVMFSDGDEDEEYDEDGEEP